MALVVRVKPGDHKVVSNEATVASDVLDPDFSDNTANATTAVRVADLKIVKTSDADTYKPSSQITYTITVTNNGPGNAENVVVTDALPLTPTTASPCSTRLHARRSTATCNLGTIAPLATRTVTIAVIVPKGKYGGTSSTRRPSASATFDLDPSNNSSTRVVLSGNPPKP